MSVPDLAALEPASRHFSLRPSRPVHNLLAGRHASRVRGRGLDFDDLRPYQPGDDVRSIDWNVTARMTRPFVRVFTEEKDRPAIMVVDQRINMFFGSRVAMKSVTAAEAAALCAWRVLGEGDRVGGVVFDDGQVVEHRPARGRGAVLRLLETVATSNRALRADTTAKRTPSQLDAALDKVTRVAHHDHQIVVITDCDGRDAVTRDLLRRLSEHNDVVVLLVYDPFLLQLPDFGTLVVTDGELQVEVGLGTARIRKSLAEAGDRRAKELLNWQKEIGVTVVPLSTADDTAAQVCHLLGTRAQPARGAR